MVFGQLNCVTRTSSENSLAHRKRQKNDDKCHSNERCKLSLTKTFESVDKIWSVTIPIKRYRAILFNVLLFLMLFKVVLFFESVDAVLPCDHSNESYWAVLSRGTVYYAVQAGSNFKVCGWNPKVWSFKRKLLSSTFLWYCLLCCARWF